MSLSRPGDPSLPSLMFCGFWFLGIDFMMFNCAFKLAFQKFMLQRNVDPLNLVTEKIGFEARG